jgi:hypothetical protein
MKKRKHLDEEPSKEPHELTDDAVRAIMSAVDGELLALCEVALDQSCPNTSRACKDMLLKETRCLDR